MAGNHTRVQSKRGDHEVAVSSTTTDAPLLPIDQIERLHHIAPDRVGWVFEQTAIESQNRRNETKRLNTLIFVERLAGLTFALAVAVLGLGCAVYLALHDKEITASIIGGATLVGLVTAFVAAKGKDS